MALTIGDDEVVHDGRWIRMLRREVRTPDGALHHWEMVERRTHGPIVAVVALTDDDHVLLLRTFRVPARAWMLEVPAGLMDVAGESPLETAKRELLEETGYEAPQWETLARGHFNAGLTADEIVYFLARGARRVRAPEHEALEAIELFSVPRRQLAEVLHHPPPDTHLDVKLFSLLWFLDVPR
ncbi:MAG: NUDIX hydrolase [Polyangiales bacterium]